MIKIIILSYLAHAETLIFTTKKQNHWKLYYNKKFGLRDIWKSQTWDSFCYWIKSSH